MLVSNEINNSQESRNDPLDNIARSDELEYDKFVKRVKTLLESQGNLNRLKFYVSAKELNSII